MNLEFSNDYQKKLMAIRFAEATHIGTSDDVRNFRSLWTKALSSWHSPYKAIIDCSLLTVSDDPNVHAALQTMGRFLTGLFLKRAVGFGAKNGVGHDFLFFEVVASEQEAAEKLGVAREIVPKEVSDFRSLITFENHFRQQVIELSFEADVRLTESQQLAVLKSKLQNNLMQWHSKWNLLIDCSKLELSEALFGEFEGFLKYFRGFFLKQAIGYGPRAPKQAYPFPVYRARHAAVARLEGEGMVSSDEANCRSRQNSQT